MSERMKISVNTLVEIDEVDKFLDELLVDHPVDYFRSDLVVVTGADDEPHDQIRNARSRHMPHDIVDEVLPILEQDPGVLRMLFHQASNDFGKEAGEQRIQVFLALEHVQKLRGELFTEIDVCLLDE